MNRAIACVFLVGCALEPCPDDPNTNCIAHDPDPPDVHTLSYEAVSAGNAANDFVALVATTESGKQPVYSLVILGGDGGLITTTPLALALDGNPPNLAGDRVGTTLVATRNRALNFLFNGSLVHTELVMRAMDVGFANGAYWVAVAGESRELRRYSTDGHLLQTFPSNDPRFAVGATIAIEGDDIVAGTQLHAADTVVVVDRVHAGVRETLELWRQPSPNNDVYPWMTRPALRDGAIAMAIGRYNEAGELVIRAADGTITRTPIVAPACSHLVATTDGYLAICGDKFLVIDPNGALVRSGPGADRSMLVSRDGHAIAVSTIDSISFGTRVIDRTTDRVNVIYRGMR